MKRYTLSFRNAAPVLAGAVLACAVLLPSGSAPGADEGPVARGFPAGIGDAYRTLAESMRTEDMAAFMSLFHRDFIYEALDGAGTDRGPWRRLWLDRFADFTYEKAAFSAVELIEAEDTRVVISVRQVTVVRSSDGERRLKETVYQDTWIRPETAWELELRVESEVVSEGAVADDGPRTITSSKVAALAESLRGGDSDAIASFWKDAAAAGVPLVEPIPDDAGHRWVTFLWRGDGNETSVRVRGGLPAREGSKPLARVDGSDVWYRTERLPAGVRFTYSFDLVTAVGVPASGNQAAELVPVRSTSADRLNRRALDGASLLELPAPVRVPWTFEVEGRSRGIVERHTISSDVLGERRFVSVYTPPGYSETDSRYAAAFVLDEGTYSSRRVTGTVLDNLIAEKKIPPVVLFMVHSEGSRSETLAATKELVRFLGEELVAWARQEFHIGEEPRRTLIGGSGLGGLLAVSTAIEYPGTFWDVLVEDGTLSRCVEGPPDADYSLCVQRRLTIAEKLPLRFFLVVGILEDETVRHSMQHLRDVLEARAYSTTLRYAFANRHATTWQEALAYGLMDLLVN